MIEREDVRLDMIEEAIRIIDAARKEGVILRLIGGLAVRSHCTEIEFCDRDYSDIDMVGLSKQIKGIIRVFESLGYKENMHVAQATGLRQIQFYRECTHRDAETHAFVHPDDHVDVFMNNFKMDHDIDLRDRLTIDDYTISVSDLLMSKLQIAKINEKDIKDILTILKDMGLAQSDGKNAINVRYVAELCSRDWGLAQDIFANLYRCLEVHTKYGLDEKEGTKVKTNIMAIQSAIESFPKTLRWKIRSAIGKRLAWRRDVENQQLSPSSVEQEFGNPHSN